MKIQSYWIILLSTIYSSIFAGNISLEGNLIFIVVIQKIIFQTYDKSNTMCENQLSFFNFCYNFICGSFYFDVLARDVCALQLKWNKIYAPSILYSFNVTRMIKLLFNIGAKRLELKINLWCKECSLVYCSLHY